MNYIIIGCVLMVIIHFCLYYLNIDVFNLSNNVLVDTNIIKDTNSLQATNSLQSTDNIKDKSIEDSINQLKSLNEYIINGHNAFTPH